jgi:hypothetical protein
VHLPNDDHPDIEFVQLERALQRLSYRERTVIEVSVGVYGGPPMYSSIVDEDEAREAAAAGRRPRTRKQIFAESHGISVRHLDAIHSEAVQKLRFELTVQARQAEAPSDTAEGEPDDDAYERLKALVDGLRNA